MRAEWMNFHGLYETNLPCEICGSTPAGSQSWYCFTVCEEHAKLSPIEIGNLIRGIDG